MIEFITKDKVIVDPRKGTMEKVIMNVDSVRYGPLGYAANISYRTSSGEILPHPPIEEFTILEAETLEDYLGVDGVTVTEKFTSLIEKVTLFNLNLDNTYGSQWEILT